MNTANIDNSSLTEAFDSHANSLNGAPQWWADLKSEAFAEFGKLPYPRRNHEAWRFASIKDLSNHLVPTSKPTDEATQKQLIDRSNYLDTQAAQVVFANGQEIAFNQVSEELAAKGVIFTTIKRGLSEYGDILKDYFMKQEISLGSEKFAALHTAFLEDGILLYVPKGVEIEAPLSVYNWAVGDEAVLMPHTLVIAEEFSKVQLVEAHLSNDETAPAFSCGVNHLFAGVGAKIDYTLMQNFNEETLGFQINSNIAGKDSTVKTLSVNVGCRHYRSETHGQIRGNGAHVEMLSLAVADENQEIDQRTLQTHSAPHATSDLLFKNALKDNSKTIFSGLIKVDESAQQTDAYQTNRNLLLSNTAEANSLPGLEIEANDVKCSHGATTAQIEEDEIFYMLARGITREAAQELIVYGFFEEVLERIDNETLAENVRQVIQNKIRRKS